MYLKTKYFHSFILLLLVASCATYEPAYEEEASEDLAIQLVSGIGTIEAVARGEGVITSPLAANLPVSFVRLDAPRGGEYPSGYGRAPFLYGQIYAGDNRISIIPQPYYQADGGNTCFIGWYPDSHPDKPGTVKSVWDVSRRTVTFAIDGSTDILLAQPVEGSKNHRFGISHPLVFTHVLSQVLVSVKFGHADYAPYWGDITAVEFVGKKQNGVLTLPDPLGIASGDMATADFPATGATNLKMQGKGTVAEHPVITPSTTEKEVGYAMLAPHKPGDTAAKLQLRIATSLGGIHLIDIPYAEANLQAGSMYHLKLTFNAAEIVLTTVIEKWTDSPNSSDPPIDIGTV